jgi:hypothetical protein
LKINYSTAKTILRVFRKENRILKKSSLKLYDKGNEDGSNIINELWVKGEKSRLNEVSKDLQNFSKVVNNLFEEIMCNKSVLYQLLLLFTNLGRSN